MAIKWHNEWAVIVQSRKCGSGGGLVAKLCPSLATPWL